MNNQSMTPYVFGDELVRVHQDESGDPWFVAKDVCRVLGIQNASDTVRKVLEEDERGVDTIYTPGGEQEVLTVSESGLYALIFRSRKPEAKAFRKWVTSEVLPALRKRGQYSLDDLESARAERTILLQSIKERAGSVAMRTTQRVSMLNIALQVCKAEGVADELSVLSRYVSMCDVVVGRVVQEPTNPEDAIVEQFVSECMEMADGERVESADLFNAFCAWCKAKGLKQRSRTWLGIRLGRVLERQRGATSRYVGARLLN